MYFLTLVTVAVPHIEENALQNKIVEKEKENLRRAIAQRPEDSLLLSVILHRLEMFSSSFSRAVDTAVSEKLEPFNVNTEERQYLEFVDQTDYITAKYEGLTDCIKLPQGTIVPVVSAPYYGRFTIWEGKVFQMNAGPARQPRRTRKAKRMKALQQYPFKRLYKDLREFAERYQYCDWHEEQQAYGYFENPSGLWDWYSIGGRWPCQLLVKDTCAQYVPSVLEHSGTEFQPPEGYRWASAARVKDIQWNAFRENLRSHLGERYFQLREIFHTGQIPQGFYGQVVEDGILCGDKMVYQDGVPLEECLDQNDPFHTRKYPITACQFVDRDGNVAVEDDFVWNGHTEDWEEKLDGFVDSLAPDDVLVVVDCHI